MLLEYLQLYYAYLEIHLIHFFHPEDLMKDVHFSGGMLSSRKDGEKILSFKEKMSDIINRSKAMKAERQLHQEEVKNIVHRLDDNWQLTVQKITSEVGQLVKV